MQDFQTTQAALKLSHDLAKGRKSGEEKGWLTLEEVEKKLGILRKSLAKQPQTQPTNF